MYAKHICMLFKWITVIYSIYYCRLHFYLFSLTRTPEIGFVHNISFLNIYFGCCCGCRFMLCPAIYALRVYNVKLWFSLRHHNFGFWRDLHNITTHETKYRYFHVVWSVRDRITHFAANKSNSLTNFCYSKNKK